MLGAVDSTYILSRSPKLTFAFRFSTKNAIYLTPWNRVLFGKTTVAQEVSNYPTFMEAIFSKTRHWSQA
jgi:hypothetical protein